MRSASSVSTMQALTLVHLTSQAHSLYSQLPTERDIDSFLLLDSELVSPAEWGGILPMAANSGRGLLKLCIADANKDCERHKPSSSLFPPCDLG